MIVYPMLQAGMRIGVTAPSSGVSPRLHELLDKACRRMEERGYEVECGETVHTQHKAKSASAFARAEELNRMLADEAYGFIFPPWGGELLIEVLEHLNLNQIGTKWVMGYSDISLLLLAITLKTGMATAHGSCFMDLRGEHADVTTAMWESVLTTPAGQSVTQHSSARYQKQWADSPNVFHLTEPTRWQTVSGRPVKFEGRLLGGCIDVIRHVIGTPYGDVKAFQHKFINSEPLLWYLENCELNAADVRRSLVQMRLAGWFDNCTGLMFGRSSANQPVDGYTIEDVYKDLANELELPMIYDIDCGHVPPQITLINGAYAVVEARDGHGAVTQFFK
ncbi:LD-carboxypeptidase [Paenibacillus sp. CAA11]|uniref:S66 family peptidase n=1 Tax=Paenibacillus sp. CAA11 TaxID=1532905 RepID=UPI000D392EB1|nr:S66 peptidase family protein [Paenibacillus sp. CAA11]AWB43667.1 LD-carboxypeptidase [Paenibacillus sp. CAA11]